MEASASQLVNALLPIAVSVLGRVTSVTVAQPLNASLGSWVIPSSSTILVMYALLPQGFSPGIGPVPLMVSRPFSSSVQLKLLSVNVPELASNDVTSGVSGVSSCTVTSGVSGVSSCTVTSGVSGVSSCTVTSGVSGVSSCTVTSGAPAGSTCSTAAAVSPPHWPSSTAAIRAAKIRLYFFMLHLLSYSFVMPAENWG